MDVLFVIAQLNGGGSQNVLKQVAESLFHKGKKVSILNLDRNNINQINIPKEINIIGQDKLNYWFRKFNFIYEIIFIRNVLKKNKPKIVFSFIARTNIILILASINLYTKVYISERNDPKKQNIGYIKNILRRYLYNYANVVTYNSKNAFKELNNYVNESKLVYLPNPIKQDIKIINNDLSNHNNKKWNFLFIGKIDYQKGIDILIKAFNLVSNKISESSLNIVGDSYNDYKRELELLEKKFELKNIKWSDYQSGISEIFEESDIFILPSRYEGAPNVLLEAISWGKPIICSDGIDEAFYYLKDNYSALFFKNENYHDLANKMYLLATDTELKNKLIENVKKTDLSEHISALNTWYEKLFNG
tara:strand:- start:1346 stop:2431 length:1086 start_codon:yes stop_codon:yes gene_type:complete